MFGVRLRSGIILVALALLTIISGGYVLFGTLLAISLIGLGELYRAARIQKKDAMGLAVTGYLATVVYYGMLLLKLENYSTILLIFILVGKYLQAENQGVMYAVICAVGALISMVGDLAASAIKRNHEIKDYGTLIPGHGGILDRFDSVIFTAPIIYLLASTFIH